MARSLVNGRVLFPDGEIRPGSLVIEDGIIVALGDIETPAGAEYWDINGALILPGIVDVHGDSFERQLMPRPGVRFPVDVALVETDRQLVSNGITTAFHGITYSWEPGLRGRETVEALLEGLHRIRQQLACDTRVQLRYEIYNLDGVDEIINWLAAGRIQILAFNDHMPLIEAKLGNPVKLSEYAARSHMDEDAFVALVHRIARRADDVWTGVHRLAAAANEHLVHILSHDDETPDMRRLYHDLGSRFCEFPVDETTARSAIDLGDFVVLGAPNVLRGGSHCNRISVAEAASKELCSILASDYFYPSLLLAPFRLADEGRCNFSSAWAMVSANPACVLGLRDRGVIDVGRRADLIVVDAREPRLPSVQATLVAGCPVYRGMRSSP